MFFPFAIEGPDDFYKVSKDWINEVITLLKTPCPTPKGPIVRLESTPEALDHNTQFLQDCGWDFEEVFARHRGTTVDHGSEFRSPKDLERILGNHPYFGHLSHMLRGGFVYHLSRELSEEEGAKELAAQIVRGNHKSATESESEVQTLLEGDVRHGFVLPVWEDALLKAKGCQLQPGGMVRQLSLKADRTRKVKNRFTHDLSYSISQDDSSINSRVEMNRYPDMVYGWCFQRILHYLSALRARHPEKKISGAYKQISQSPQADQPNDLGNSHISVGGWSSEGRPTQRGLAVFQKCSPISLTRLGCPITAQRWEPVQRLKKATLSPESKRVRIQKSATPSRGLSASPLGSPVNVTASSMI